MSNNSKDTNKNNRLWRKISSLFGEKLLSTSLSILTVVLSSVILYQWLHVGDAKFADDVRREQQIRASIDLMDQLNNDRGVPVLIKQKFAQNLLAQLGDTHGDLRTEILSKIEKSQLQIDAALELRASALVSAFTNGPKAARLDAVQDIFEFALQRGFGDRPKEIIEAQLRRSGISDGLNGLVEPNNTTICPIITDARGRGAPVCGTVSYFQKKGFNLGQ